MSEQSKEKNFKIEKIYLKDYKGIEEKEIDLACNSFIVYASNGEGKTSVLNAIEELFTGKATSKQIKKDADKAEIWAVTKELNTGAKYKIKRVITEKTNRLDITCDVNPNFKPDGGPQTWLNDVFGEISFDLGSLLNKSSEEQVKQIKAICGIDTSFLDEKIKTAEEKRKEANVLLKSAKSVYEKASESIKGIENIDEFEEPKPITEMVSELQRMKENNRAHTQYAEKIKSLQDEIAELNKKLENAEQALEDNIKFQAALDKPQNTVELEKKIEEAENNSKKYSAIQVFKKEKENFEAVKKEYDLWDGRIELARKKRKEYLESVDLPVQGLTFSDEKGLLYNEIPLSEWNTAEKAFIEAMIKMSRKDIHLKVVRVENASLLDDENIKRLTKSCHENGYQVAFEMVSRQKQELKVEYIDETTGEIKKA